MRSLTLLFVVSVGTLFTACPPQQECEPGTNCAPVTGGGGGNTGGGTATGTGGSDGGTAPLTFVDACVGLKTANQERLIRCGSQTRPGADLALANAMTECLSQSAGLISARAEFVPQAAEACVTALRDLACDRTADLWCFESIRGLVANGGDCFYGSDCATESWCDDRMTCPGICKPRVAVGQPSDTNFGQDCAVGTSRYGGKCEAHVALGMSCAPQGGVNAPRKCVPGARCSAAEICVDDVLLAVGATCTVGGPDCKTGSRCANGTCIASSELNEPCDSVRWCKGGLQCGEANVCVRFAATGEPCGTVQCVPDNFCNGGTCAPRRAVNGTCTSHAQCANSLWCSGTMQTPGTCQAKRSVGEACPQAAQLIACSADTYCTTLVTNAAMGVCAAFKTLGASCMSGECEDGTSCVDNVCERVFCLP